ncbi:MAG: YqgE/AlgH family protein [Thermoleophilia bacterium]
MAAESLSDGPAFRRGRLLVASPTLQDPNFTRTVVLMLEHSRDGALGLVLNRPTDITAREALPEPLSDALPEDELVHQGGPVQPEAVILLADFADPEAAATLTVGTVGVVDPNEDTAGLPQRVRSVRAFGGYAGWGAGQLEHEIAEGAWIDVEADAADVFTDEPDALWRRVLDRKGGAFRLLARMPEDPSLN